MRNRGPQIWLSRVSKSPYWNIRYVDFETGRTLQRSTRTTSKKEAERILGEFRADLLGGRYERPNNATWETFRERYEMEVIPSLAPRTAEKVTTVLDAVERILKPKKLAALTASELSTFVAELRDGTRTESTILSYVAHLRSALSWAA